MILVATAHKQPNLLMHHFLFGAPLYLEASVSILSSYTRGIKVLVGNGKCLIGDCCSFSELCQDLQLGNIVNFCFGHIYRKGTVDKLDSFKVKELILFLLNYLRQKTNWYYMRCDNNCIKDQTLMTRILLYSFQA